MKTTSLHRCLALGAGASLFLASASIASAQLLAYEGFEYTSADFGGVIVTIPANGTALEGLSQSGDMGFEGVWIKTNGNNGDSEFQTTGLQYPASYPGSFVAIGGNGRNAATTANAMLRLDFSDAVTATINDANVYYVSFLGQRIGESVSDQGVISEDARNQFNLASEYPRNFGARLMSAETGNNSLGTIGKPSDWNSNGVVYGDPNPVIIDTWGLGGMENIHQVYSGVDFADEGADFIVGKINRVTNEISFWVNPTDVYGGAEGTMGGIYDGVIADVFGFGVEAGSPSSDRPVGDWLFDEIRFGLDFASVAGFEMVPEPSVIGFLGFGLIATLLGLRRRR